MKFSVNLKSINWWYWFITLIAIAVGLLGYMESFYAAIAISLIQWCHFILKKGATAFPTQVRLVYAVFATLGIFDTSHLFYFGLFFGTVMVTFFDRCFIARVLVHMPWNKEITLS